MKLSVIFLLLIVSVYSYANKIEVYSPDSLVKVNLKLTDHLYYNLEVDGDEVMWYSPVSMKTSEGTLGKNPALVSHSIKYENIVIEPVLGFNEKVRNEYNELTLNFKSGFNVKFRVYNEGVAYRFKTNFKNQLIVYDEEVEYRFWKDYPMVSQMLNDFESSYEGYYSHNKISDVKSSNLIGLPSIIDQKDLKLAITEADVFEYPGLYLTKNGNPNRFYLSGTFPNYPVQSAIGGNNLFNKVVKERADFIAKTIGHRNFPWRVMVIARNDIDLVNSNLVFKLARPSKIETDWIKPGKVAWDWWNALNLSGVDFVTGVNNESYEYFIDFASENNIEYVIMDEGWSDQFDVLLPTPMVDMEHLTNYAREKGVKLILWAVWHTIDRQYEEAFKLFEEWGIAGIKVDFINRDDQKAIEFYEKLAARAAEHHLLVNFHGCSKPTGLQRTYPNVINFEAVRGNEFNKFSEGLTPQHNVNIAFIRMLNGPMDYTPGAMRNSVEGDFSTSFENPMSYGTRCHQLGMFIVYFAPLQMLCDAPTAYEKYPDILNFLSEIPTTWDETKILSGKLGEYVVVARRKGSDWYIGGLTSWEEREIEIDLSSFADGNFQAQMLLDGINANRKAGDYQYKEGRVSSNDKLNVKMKKGGGFAIRLSR